MASTHCYRMIGLFATLEKTHPAKPLISQRFQSLSHVCTASCKNSNSLYNSMAYTVNWLKQPLHNLTRSTTHLYIWPNRPPICPP